MKLLIVTQAVDTEDPVLGFFVRWIEALAKHYEGVTVICLRKGEYSLPDNVRVFTLPQGGRSTRARALLKGAFNYRANYDAVFVHMNQEYVLVAGWLWKLLGKRVYLWRNHYAGSWLTDVAAAFCAKVFCTSKYSYTAKYKKTVLMPVGVDTERFHPEARVVRVPRSILFLARMAPSKRPDLVLEALGALARDEVAFTASFVGSALAHDAAYYEQLVERARALGVGSQMTFLPGVANSETPRLYQSHEIFVNASPSGMLDKTIFEAAACGCRVLAASKDLEDTESRFDSAESLAERLRAALAAGGQTSTLPVEENSLHTLVDTLARTL